MNLSTFTGKRIFWLATGFLLVVATILYSFNINTSSTVNSKNQPPLGTWKVTEFSGNISSQLDRPGVKLFCDDFTKYYYYPIIDDNKTFIKFLERSRKPRLKNIPREVYDTLNIVHDEKGLFIFQFNFDNGFRSNKILEGFGVQYQYTELIKGLWSFEVGFWNEQGVRGETISGTKWGGKCNFGVVGRFINENRIEGQWTYEAVETLPGTKNCVSKGEGSGRWVAIKK